MSSPRWRRLLSRTPLCHRRCCPLIGLSRGIEPTRACPRWCDPVCRRCCRSRRRWRKRFLVLRPHRRCSEKRRVAQQRPCRRRLAPAQSALLNSHLRPRAGRIRHPEQTRSGHRRRATSPRSRCLHALGRPRRRCPRPRRHRPVPLPHRSRMGQRHRVRFLCSMLIPTLFKRKGRSHPPALLSAFLLATTNA